jgi:hypothetical protein
MSKCPWQKSFWPIRSASPLAVLSIQASRRNFSFEPRNLVDFAPPRPRAGYAIAAIEIHPTIARNFLNLPPAKTLFTKTSQTLTVRCFLSRSCVNNLVFV